MQSRKCQICKGTGHVIKWVGPDDDHTKIYVPCTACGKNSKIKES